MSDVGARLDERAGDDLRSLGFTPTVEGWSELHANSAGFVTHDTTGNGDFPALGISLEY